MVKRGYDPHRQPEDERGTAGTLSEVYKIDQEPEIFGKGSIEVLENRKYHGERIAKISKLSYNNDIISAD